MTVTSRAIATFASVALVLAACTAGAAPTPTPEPRDALIQALRSTAGLHTVHALLVLKLRDAGGQESQATVEGDVDVAARELDVSVVANSQGSGGDRWRLVVVDGSVFTRMNADSWNVSGGNGRDPLEFLPTTARIAAAVEGAIRDPSTQVTSEGTEACGDSDCMRIRAEVTADVAWGAVNEMLAVEGRPGTMTMPAGFPGFAIDVWIQGDTMRLRQAANTTVVARQTISITISLARHDEPVTIVAPVPG